MLKKEITFIYWDTAEKNLYQPIVEEAQKRGYLTKLTNNKFEKCEIGFYCQHINFPQYSKFSVIMLHDIIQAYGRWPDIWYNEPWDKYDIGILPSQQWEENWNKCSQWSYTRPQIGVFKIGWPKADTIRNLQDKISRTSFYLEHKMDVNKKTILYAPAWENDRKQDDFVQAMLKLNVNILVKQAKWPESYPHIIQNIKEMYYLHKDNPKVTILPPETNIFEAIAVSDVLVSDESSTMCEAVMMGIPAVSVSNWLIPDVVPSRYPKCDYNFVVMTLKENLPNCIENIVSDYEKYKRQAEEFSKINFGNIGNTSSMIMDIIDDIINNTPIRYTPLKAKTNNIIPFIKEYKRRMMLARIEIVENYYVRYKAFRFFWNILRFLKSLIKNK